MENSVDVIQVDIFGLSLSSQISGGGYAIILKEIGGERRLPIIIGQFEAQAIAFELEGMKPPRPLTHDLLRTLIETFGYRVETVTINELKDSTFYSRIKFDAESIGEIDARPSDAIALALKFSAPIYVSSAIMDEIGFIPEYEEHASKKEEGKEESDILSGKESFEEEAKISDTSNLSVKEKKLKKLKIELDEAVTKEDYEKAAQLRDEINKMEISNLN
ncbi:MAG: bifunctional nuclease family protein [Ignavibacteria bacterium]|nr:bifunctional nuclease family protein [Ignavibacteria bacterium]